MNGVVIIIWAQSGQSGVPGVIGKVTVAVLPRLQQQLVGLSLESSGRLEMVPGVPGSRGRVKTNSRNSHNVETEQMSPNLMSIYFCNPDVGESDI